MQEDLFTTNEIKMTAVTFNCSGFPPQELWINENNFLKSKEVVSSDVFILGLQEVVEMKSKNLG